jgi:hypothetical protein
MKPSWNDAPEWANYLAQDKNCDWNWFQELPYIDEKLEEWISFGARWRFYFLGTCEGEAWRQSLEKRPEI